MIRLEYASTLLAGILLGMTAMGLWDARHPCPDYLVRDFHAAPQCGWEEFSKLTHALDVERAYPTPEVECYEWKQVGDAWTHRLCAPKTPAIDSKQCRSYHCPAEGTCGCVIDD